MKVEMGEIKKKSFTPKTITFTIESEKELAMLYLRLNCPLANIEEGNEIDLGIGPERKEKINRICWTDSRILPLFDMIGGLIPTNPDGWNKWAETVLVKEE